MEQSQRGAAAPYSRTYPPQGSTECPYKTRIASVYTILISGLIITSVTVALFYQMKTVHGFVKDHFVITMLLTSLFMTLTTNIFGKLSYEEQKMSKLMCFTLNCILAGIPLLNLEPSSLIKALIYTTILGLILSLKSFIIPENIQELFLKPLSYIHTLVLICSAYSVIFGSINSTVTAIITSISLHGGFLVYSGLLICNTQRLILNAKHPRFDPVFTAFVLFMNMINLYSRVAVFTSIKAELKPKECSNWKLWSVYLYVITEVGSVSQF